MTKFVAPRFTDLVMVMFLAHLVKQDVPRRMLSSLLLAMALLDQSMTRVTLEIQRRICVSFLETKTSKLNHKAHMLISSCFSTWFFHAREGRESTEKGLDDK